MFALGTGWFQSGEGSGSYVRQSAATGSSTLYIDQLRLGIDGTAYWFNSDSFDYFLLATYIPTIGSWSCLADGTVLVTTIRSQYFNSVSSVNGDIAIAGWQWDIDISCNKHQFYASLQRPLSRCLTALRSCD